jgi:hypothetical protein
MLVFDFDFASTATLSSHSGSLSDLNTIPKGWLGNEVVFFTDTRSEKSSDDILRRAPDGPYKPVSTAT